MPVDATQINPNASLIKIARAALLSDTTPEQVPWETIDLTDPEQRRFGDYELKALLGRGGMGVVYRAHQISLDREVAIKFIAANLADDAEFVAKFLTEAQAAARLNHPNIVPVYEVGSVDCLHYFSMPLLRGRTLADLLDERPLGVGETVSLMRKLCSAVAYAHSLGLLHLDLKPANIMLDERGEPLIGDFGLARKMDADGLVHAQEVSGTPAYMAPEQIQIKQFRLSRGTDLYALGAILYRLLTGQPPHGRGTAQQLMQNAIASRIVPVLDLAPKLPADLASICEACLKLHAEERYHTVDQLADDLARFADDNFVSVRRPPMLERARRAFRRSKVARAIAVGVGALVFGFIATTWQWQEAEAATAEADERARRMQQLADMLAVTFSDDLVNDEARNKQVSALINWLQDNEPNPHAQAELLRVFVNSLRAAGKDEVVERLTWAIPNRLGMHHREQLSRQLQALGDADHLAVALLLRLKRSDELLDDAETLDWVDQALTRYGDQRLLLTTAAMICRQRADRCRELPLQQRLQQIAGTQMMIWLYGVEGERLPVEQLRQMARSTQVNDSLAELILLLQRVLGEYPTPDSIRVPLTAMMSEREAEVFASRDAIAGLPIPPFNLLVKTCNPADTEFTDALRPDCLTVARALFGTERNGLVTRMIGSVMLRRLVPGTAEAQAAFDLRRQYVWLSENGLYVANPDESVYQFDRDTVQFGEWQAMLRQAERKGIPLLPPATWVPKNPQHLLLPEQREAK